MVILSDTDINIKLLSAGKRTQQISCVYSSLISYLLAFVMYRFVNIQSIIIWCSAVTLMNIFRFYYLQRIDTPKFNLTIFNLIMILLGLVWGSVFFINMGNFPSEISEIITIILIGFTMGAAFGNITSKLISLSYSYSLLIPFFIKKLIATDDEKYIILFVIILFAFFLTKMVLFLNGEVISNVKLRLEKEYLIEDLKEKNKLESELSAEKIKNVKNSKLASLAEIASGVAHEINNPLAILSGKLQILKSMVSKKTLTDDFLNNEIIKMLKVTERMANIIRTLRNLSRVESEDSLRKVDLRILLRDIADRFKNTFIEKEINFTYAENTSFTLLALEGYLDQVLTNLVTNACDAVKSLEPKARDIEISCIADEQFVRIRVSDSGDGVITGLEEKIFEPFFTTKDIGEGTGLGLSLSKSLMVKIGGDLTYQIDNNKHFFEVKIQRSN